MLFFFFFKQKTAYDMRISDWSSDVCSSDLGQAIEIGEQVGRLRLLRALGRGAAAQVGDDRLRVQLLLDVDGDGIDDERTFILRVLAAPDELRSAERRAGKECVRTCISRWSSYHNKQKQISRTITNKK